MNFKVYEDDCRTFNMCELETLKRPALYSWCTLDGKEYHGLPWMTFRNADYIQIICQGNKIISIPKNNIKAIYKLFK